MRSLSNSFVILCSVLLLNPCALFATDHSKESVQTKSAVEQPVAPVQAKLVSEEAAVQPGRPFWVGVKLKMADGWDTYWRNPGDSGFPTQVVWKLPDGFKAGPLLWPYPQKIVTDSLVAFGYTDTVLLMAEITPPEKLASDQKVEIKADVNWLACKDACVPGSASLALALPISDAQPSLDEAVKELFTIARKAIPQKEGDFSVTEQADQLILSFAPQEGSSHTFDELLFIPEEGEVIDYAAPQVFQTEGQKITINLKRARPEAALNSLKGVLLVSEKGSGIKKAIQVDSMISKKPVAPAADHQGVSSVGLALVLAFFGGLILNVMPCVLPVVALKIFGFVKIAGEKRGLIFKHGGVFSLGVLISFWILSGALLILRAYGEGVGWGFQLQEPIFVAILASLLFLLGLSLFGVFELGTSLISLGSKAPSSSASPLKSSFMSGVLATLVATPCTGPLLGPALGFAMTLPALKALLIFSAMGLGMASPYLIFSAFPHLIRFLPKPGNWMVAFKQFMGFFMMATVVWLIWVFGAQTDNLATFILLGALLIMAIGAWIFGTWGALTRRRPTRIVATLIALLMIFSGGAAVVNAAKQTHSETQLVSAEAGWEKYSPERVEELRTLGVPVFVDFTAKWCLICQANKVTLHSSDITKSFHEKGVVTMTADWTKKDPVITQELEKLGRTGVPVYVLYPGDSKETPYILPQTLTASVVQEYLDKLKAPSSLVHAH